MLPQYGLSAVLTHWQFAPVVTVGSVLLAGLYGWGIVRVARRHPARRWPLWRAFLFGTGLLVVVIATQSGLGAYDDLLFYDHMIQHILLLMVAPPLLIAGQPLTLLLHASRNPMHTWAKRVIRSRVASFLTWPVFGAVAYAAAVMSSHLTAIASYTEQSQAWHDAEHALFVIIGYLFYLPILGTEPIKWRLSYPIRFALLLLLMPIDTFTGVALGYASANSPGVPAGPRPGWAPDPVSDLHAGGAVMWIAGDGVMFGLMMIVFLMWARDQRAVMDGRSYFERARQENLATMVASARSGDEPAPVPADGRTIDDDEHLAAYNEYLARLNRQHESAG
ncbi:MAG: cytochrome c oxidase assembly protein [Actinobacteria bacterium]|nr:cytochrome c oxidase assembly protein [Actinomycetota bacterium]